MKAIAYEKYGSPDVLSLDYTKEDFTISGQVYDVIFDMVARTSYSGCVRSLKPKGRYLMANPGMSKMLRSVLTSSLTDKTWLKKVSEFEGAIFPGLEIRAFNLEQKKEAEAWLSK